MSNNSEQKIIDAALKIFSEKGYVGATTMAIAEEAGLSEKTLFRRFKSKENLFNMTVIAKGQQMQKFFDESVLEDKEFESPRDCMETLINNYRKLGDDHFEFFHLSINERTRIHEPFQQYFNFKISEYLQEHIPNKKIDYMTFGLTISAFMYMVITERNLGGKAIDLDYVLARFIENCVICLQD